MAQLAKHQRDGLRFDPEQLDQPGSRARIGLAARQVHQPQDAAQGEPDVGQGEDAAGDQKISAIDV